MQLIACLFAIGALMVPAVAQFVNLPGQIVSSATTELVLEGDAVQSIRYSFPQAPSSYPANRLQTILPQATVQLVATGSYTNDSGEPLAWVAQSGFEAWWSIGSPADSPTAPNAWGGVLYGYTYGDDSPAGQSSTYFGTGMVTTLNLTRYVDPTSPRERRAWSGNGSVDLYLNVRRDVTAFASGHWTHEHTVRVLATAQTPWITYRFAEPGDPVFRHVTGAWGADAWVWSEEKNHVPTQPGTSSLPFPIEESSVGQLDAPGIAPRNYYDVLVQIQSRQFCLNGVENLGGVQAVCGGNALLYGTVSEPHFAETLWTTAGTPGVGSMQVGLLGFDGQMDWQGQSGQWTPSTSYSSYGLHWLQSPGASLAGGFEGLLRVHGDATFVPEDQSSRIAWFAQAGQRSRVRLVGREIVP